MKVVTIAYHRVINLGNYESKRLELSAELAEGENVEGAINSLAELVERKARENFTLIIDAQDLRHEVRELKKELEQLKAEKAQLTGQVGDLPPMDDIPFDSGSSSPTSTEDDPMCGF